MYLTSYIKSLIVSLTILTLTILVTNPSKANTTCTTNSLGDRTCTTVTGNILSNSTFGTGTDPNEVTTTTDWSTTGSDGIHTHGNFGFTYPSGADNTGGVLAFEGHTEDNVYQDSALVGDGHLTQSQINEVGPGHGVTCEPTYVQVFCGYTVHSEFNESVPAETVQSVFPDVTSHFLTKV